MSILCCQNALRIIQNLQQHYNNISAKSPSAKRCAGATHSNAVCSSVNTWWDFCTAPVQRDALLIDLQCSARLGVIYKGMHPLWEENHMDPCKWQDSPAGLQLCAENSLETSLKPSRSISIRSPPRDHFLIKVLKGLIWLRGMPSLVLPPKYVPSYQQNTFLLLLLLTSSSTILPFSAASSHLLSSPLSSNLLLQTSKLTSLIERNIFFHQRKNGASTIRRRYMQEIYKLHFQCNNYMHAWPLVVWEM